MLLFTLLMSTLVAAIPQMLTNSSTPATTTASSSANTVSQTTLISSDESEPMTTSGPVITPDHTNIRDCTITMPGLGGHIACDINNLLAPRPEDFPTGAPTSRFCYSNRYNHRRDCNRTELPVYTGAFPTIRYEQYAYNTTFEKVNTNVATDLLSYCFSSSESAISKFLATAEIAPVGVLPATIVSTDRGTWTYTGSWAQTTEYHYVSEMAWTPSAPCCLTCTLLGGTAQVFQWPATTADPNAPSSLVDEKGYTFVYPSIYVAFETLHAHDLCGPLGPGYNATTLAFDPDDLSTTAAWSWDTSAYIEEPPIMVLPRSMQFTRATFGVAVCSDIPVSFYQDPRIPGSTYSNLVDYSSAYTSILTGYAQDTETSYSDMWKLYTVTYNPCSPLLSVPTQLYTIDTLWKDCRPGIDAFFDPPFTLTSGNGLGPGLVTAVDPAADSPPAPTTTYTAVVLPVPEPVTASKTNPIGVVPTPTPSPDPPVIAPTPSSHTPPPPSTQAPNPPVVNDPPVFQPPPQLESKVSPAPLEPPKSTQTGPNPPVINNPPVETSEPAYSAPILVPIPPATSNNPTQPFVVNNPPEGNPDPSQPAPILVPIPSNPPQATPVENRPSAGTRNTKPIPAQSQPVVNEPPSPRQQQPTQNDTPAPATITLGKSTIVADPSSAFVIDAQTLTPGGGIIYSGTSYSLASNAGALIIGGVSTQILPVAPPPPPPTSALQVSYAIGTQTLFAGGPAVTYSGTTYSLPTGGASLIVNGSQRPVSSYLAAPTSAASGQAPSASGTAIIVSKIVTASYVLGGSNILAEAGTDPLTKQPGLSSTATPGLGDIIAGIGGFQTPTPSPLPPSVSNSNSSVEFFGGAATCLRPRYAVLGLGLALGCWMVGIWVG